MSQPSGIRRSICPYCGEHYTRTNWMRREKDSPLTLDGKRLTDTHLISCYRKSYLSDLRPAKNLAITP